MLLLFQKKPSVSKGSESWDSRKNIVKWTSVRLTTVVFGHLPLNHIRSCALLYLNKHFFRALVLFFLQLG